MSIPALEPRPDTLVEPLLFALSDCLCAEVASTVGGMVCWCGVMPGALVASACDCGGGASCGQAWIRLVQVYPTKAFPTQDRGAEPCTALTAAVFEVGIQRCAPAMGPKGQAPSEDAQLQAVHRQLSDMAAMRRVFCCAPLKGKTVALGAYNPFGPDGGCVGGTLTATVEL